MNRYSIGFATRPSHQELQWGDVPAKLVAGAIAAGDSWDDAVWPSFLEIDPAQHYASGFAGTADTLTQPDGNTGSIAIPYEPPAPLPFAFAGFGHETRCYEFCDSEWNQDFGYTIDLAEPLDVTRVRPVYNRELVAAYRYFDRDGTEQLFRLFGEERLPAIFSAEDDGSVCLMGGMQFESQLYYKDTPVDLADIRAALEDLGVDLKNQRAIVDALPEALAAMLGQSPALASDPFATLFAHLHGRHAATWMRAGQNLYAGYVAFSTDRDSGNPIVMRRDGLQWRLNDVWLGVRYFRRDARLFVGLITVDAELFAALEALARKPELRRGVFRRNRVKAKRDDEQGRWLRLGCLLPVADEQDLADEGIAQRASEILLQLKAACTSVLSQGLTERLTW